MEEMNIEEFTLIPTVHVEVESVGFSADVIRLYDMPHDIVRKAMNVASGPAQMEEMLGLFKLAIMDQSKVVGLDLMTFAEVADMLGNWALKSTPDDDEVAVKVVPVLSEPARDELVGLMEELGLTIEPKKRGRHVAENSFEDGGALNDPGDGISPFSS